jgi:mRNA-degrading endonuclease RelE of RelBE toxin-antitoxin system
MVVQAGSMQTQLSSQVIEKLKKLDVRIRNSFIARVKIFEKNHQDPILDNHLLKREYKGYRSIDITNDYRALYEEIQGNDEVIAYFL